MMDDEMYVTKRNGQQEIVSFDKILKRIKTIGQEADIKINYTTLVMKVIDQLYNGISTTKIDELSAEQCASMASIHPDYNALAGRITISNHHKNTSCSFVDVMTQLYQYKDKHNKHSPLVTEEFMMTVLSYQQEFEMLCNYERDYLIDYFGYKTLERAYLMKIDKKTVERPQHMWLRVAIGIHGPSANASSSANNELANKTDVLQKICETYNYMSNKYFTHATPTLFNAGTPHPQLSSCYLLAMESDSIDGIYNTLKDCALISKWAGGIGLHIHNVRASGSHIRGTNGSSNGIVPMLKVFNNTAKYVDQCVHPETIIYTTLGPKQIQTCIGGVTEIFNKTGGKETIQRVLEHAYDGPMLEIRTGLSMKSLRITPEHPVYVLHNADRSQIDSHTISADLDRGLSNFEWSDAKDIRVGDWLVYAMPQYTVDFAELSESTCFFYGVILAGIANYSASFRSNMEDPQCIYTRSTPANQAHIRHFLEKYNVPYEVQITEGYNVLYWKQTTVLPFSNSDFYTNAMCNNNCFNNEVRNPISVGQRWTFLPLPKIQQIVNGLGDTTILGLNELNESILFLYLRLGKLDDYLNAKQTNSYAYSNEMGLVESMPIVISKQTQIINYQDKILVQVKSVFQRTYKGILYDLQMKDEHNYLLHSGLVHNGGGKRNGSFAIYLEPWHADIEVFLQMRKNHGDEELKARDLFYALWIPDLFMERIKADGTWTLMCPDECPGLADVYGQAFVDLYVKYETAGKGRKTVKARELWFQVMDAQIETGTPYLLYKDACNKKSNQQNIGTIKSSNLCVAPETMILTDKGHCEIQQLNGERVNVWNGTEFSEVEVFQTGEDQELIDVETDDGCNLTCTPYHKFFIQNSYSKRSITIVEAKDLKKGDKLMKCSYPVIDGKEKMNYPYTHGFFCGDGTYSNNNLEHSRCKFKSLNGHHYCKRHIDFETDNNIDTLNNDTTMDKVMCNANSYVKKPIIYLYDEKKILIDHMDYRTTTESSNRKILQLPLDIAEKFFVPMNSSLDDKLEWLAGYCDADGTISNNQDNQQLQMCSINREFLLNIKLMLQTCGVNPKVKQMREAGTSYLPDGKGGHKDFITQPLYRLLMTSVDLEKIVALGFSPKRLKIHSKTIPNRSASRFIAIESVTNNNRRDSTYCFTEPKRSTGIFNGILTSQCSEIVQYSDKNETAVCNLASIALPAYVIKTNSSTFFDYELLHKVTKTVTYNLNRIIDVNYYPTPKTELSNKRHRPIGIGVQGLADIFMMMDIAFTSEEAKQMNKHIFETIYHAALEQSVEMAKTDGPYETFSGSPASKGQLQFDLWNVDPTNERYDWTALKAEIQVHGLRNSLLLAPMPTASTSQILGYNECIEPITSNIYNRRTIAGEFILANKYLMNDLIKMDLWNEKIKNSIIANHGSVQHIEVIPKYIREKYKTVWEIPMRQLIDMAAERGAFICQRQSLNLWLEDPNYSTLTSMHF